MGRSMRFFGYGFLTNAADASAPRDWGQYFFSITGEGKHWLKTCQPPFCFFDSPFAVVAVSEKTCVRWSYVIKKSYWNSIQIQFRWLHGKARWPVYKQACFTKFCPHSLGGSAKKTMFLFHGTFPSRSSLHLLQLAKKVDDVKLMGFFISKKNRTKRDSCWIKIHWK